MKEKLTFNNIKNKIVNGSNKEKIMILVLLGVLLIVISIPTTKTKSKIQEQTESETSAKSYSSEEYEEYLEKKLTKALSTVDGVGKVQVIITLKGTSEKVLVSEGNSSESSISETDSDGGVRETNEKSQSQSYLSSDTTSGSAPYVAREMTPEVEGVMIIAQGGGNAIVVTNVTKAVEALLNVPIHKIQVLKMSN